MKLVVGLGNPGRKYQATRHNVGFEVVQELAKRHGRSEPKEKFQGELVTGEVGGEKLLLLCPRTFMNLSGASVLEARDFYKLADTDLLVVCDDFQLPLAKLRIRPQGSAGGQKGLADVIRRLGTEQIPRLRIGVGDLPSGWDPADFVLGRFTKAQQPEAEVSFQLAADAVELWATAGIAAAMNRYN
ncbi:MAG TPA: aminoacyl-tRNA hydrolase [Pirellulales bacterium]|jgi:PTH1 family peptidyl-tRNA hydrolase|nr:aminoacyl-tRNA hydrolase [Pirellulales bacterium]